MSKMPLIIIVLCSILCTSIPGYLAFQITKTYYQHHPYVPDPAGALYTNIAAYEHLSHSNRVETALDQLETNHKYPFRTIPLILFAPDLLVNPWGHMVTLLSMYSLFLFFLGYTIYNRSNKNLLYSLTSLIVFSTATVFFSPYYGLASYMLDLCAGLSLASATLNFLEWHRTRKPGWLIGFSIFISFAILSRYIVVVYACILFLPLVCYSVYIFYKAEKNFFKNLILPVSIIVSITGLLCGYFVIRQFKWNYEYYTYWKGLNGVTMNLGIPKSMYSYIYNYLGFFALYHTVIVGFLVLLNIYLFSDRFKSKMNELLISAWIFASIPLYWILFLETNGNRVAAAYLVAFPVMFISLISPASFGDTRKKKFPWIAFCILLIAGSIASGVRASRVMMRVSESPSAGAWDMKQIQVTASDYMHTHQGTYIVNNFLCREYLNYGIWLEHCYQYGGRPAYNLGNSFFLPQQETAQLLYPGFSIQQVMDSIMKQVDQQYNFIVAFNDPDSLSYTEIFPDHYSYELAKNLSKKIQSDPDWKKTFQLHTATFSELAFYRKLSADSMQVHVH